MRFDQAEPGLDDGAWFHGSPTRLEALRVGSTITRSRATAEAFSHRPCCVGFSVSSEQLEVCHNGTLPGFLYVVSEEVGEADVHLHPNSSFTDGRIEWLTDRPLRVELIAEMAAEPADCEQCPGKRKKPAD